MGVARTTPFCCLPVIQMGKPTDDEEFTNFLEEIEKLAEKLEVKPSYIEEEFVIDGELVTD